MKQSDYDEYLPKYIKVYNYIIQEIENGKIQIGQKLPTEMELMSLFQVNRSTIRAAFEKLERANMIMRKQGKGTFLISSHSPQFVRTLQSFSTLQADVQSEKPIEWRVLNAREEPAGKEVAAKLHLELHAPIYTFLRVGYLDNEPFVIESVKNTTKLIPCFKEIDLTTSYYPVLANKFKVIPTRLPLTLQSIMPDFSVREILSLSENQPCIELNSVLYDQEDNPLDLTKAIYRGDKYIFSGESSIKF